MHKGRDNNLEIFFKKTVIAGECLQAEFLYSKEMLSRAGSVLLPIKLYTPNEALTPAASAFT